MNAANKAKYEQFQREMILSGSHERPYKFLDTFAQVFRAQEEPVAAWGPDFWRLIMQGWSGFDAIPHRHYQRQFAGLRPWWSPGLMQTEDRQFYDALPKKPIPIYRGQSRDRPVGLSWTLDREVATKFAEGHRSIRVPNPVIYEAHIRKQSIAFVQVSRHEAEIVLFTPPRASRIRQVSIIYG